MKNVKMFLAAVCVILASTLFVFNTGYSKEARGVTKDAIKIGIMLDLTGPIATDCIPMGKGMRTYFRHINDQGGVGGKKIRGITEDFRYSIPTALAVFKKLIFRNKVLALGGLPSTGAMVAMFSQFEKEKAPIISLGSADRMIAPYKRYVFPIMTSYGGQIRVMFDYIINELKVKDPRVAIIYPDVEFGKVALNHVRECSKFYSVKLVDEEVLNFGVTDAGSQILGMKRAKADFVFMQMPIAQSVIVLREARKYGYKPRNFFGTYASGHDEVVRMAGKTAHNLIATNSSNSWSIKTRGIERLKKITLGYYPEPERDIYTRYYIQGWVIGELLVEGMKKAGKGLDNESLVDALEKLRDFETGDLFGPITYTPTKHLGAEYCRLFKADMDKKVLVPIGGWRKPSW